MREDITEEMKKEFLEGHFVYEIESLKDGISLINPDGSMRDIVLVGILTRIRNIHEFFYGTGKGIKAHVRDFVEGYNDKKSPKEIKKWCIQINKFLSHLDYDRVKETYELYPVHFLYNHFIELTIDFLSRLPDKYMGTGLRKLRVDLNG